MIIFYLKMNLEKQLITKWKALKTLIVLIFKAYNEDILNSLYKLAIVK